MPAILAFDILNRLINCDSTNIIYEKGQLIHNSTPQELLTKANLVAGLAGRKVSVTIIDRINEIKNVNQVWFDNLEQFDEGLFYVIDKKFYFVKFD